MVKWFKWSLVFENNEDEYAYWLSRWNATKTIKAVILSGTVIHNILAMIELFIVTVKYDAINVLATTFRWLFTLVLAILFIYGPLVPSRRTHWILWMLTASLLSIVTAFFIDIKTVMCYYKVSGLTCEPTVTNRPRLRFRYLYNILGPAVLLIVFNNDWRWQFGFTTVVLVTMTYATVISYTSLTTILTDVWMTYGSIALFFYLAYVNEVKWRANFMLTKTLKEKNRKKQQLTSALEKEIQDKQRALQLLSTESHKRQKFMSYIFHEIRVPLNSLMLTLAYLETDETFMKKLSVDEQEQMTSVIPNLEAIEGILTDSLDYEKLSKGFFELKIKSFDYYSTIVQLSESLKSLWQSRNQTFTLEIDQTVTNFGKFVFGDEMRLRQVISNYLSNACKYSPLGGHIKMSTRIMNISTSDTVIFYLEVIDNGIGIADSDKPKIFTPFINIEKPFPEMQKGTGLGLSICAEIMKLMGGTYGFESTLGEGSKFWIRVPMTISTQDNSTATDITQEVPHNKLKILIVDDDSLTLTIMSKVLKNVGHDVETSNDALEAIEHLKENPKKYNVILMDEVMNNLKGHEAISMIYQLGIKVPVISMTGDTTINTKERLMNAGAMEVLFKPVSSTLLQKTLNLVSQ